MINQNTKKQLYWNSKQIIIGPVPVIEYIGVFGYTDTSLVTVRPWILKKK